jgi:acetate kinase
MKPVLVLNAGSSSLKFAVFDDRGEALARGQVAGIGGPAQFSAQMRGVKQREALAAGLSPAGAQAHVFGWLAAQGFGADALSGAGHRLVHGGTQFTAPLVVDDGVMAALQHLRRLAPLHMPFGLDALAAARAALPGVPQIACFDTAFHATQPEIATRFPLPQRFWEKGYRRYGFHGLNYEHVVKAFPRETGLPLPARLIIAHLGSGASMCAVKDGVSVATTMGYSTLDGLIMGTRPGTLDPGLLIALMQDEGLDAKALERLLYKESGLLGLSGLSNDMKVLLDSDDPRAKMAVAHYVQGAAKQAAGLAVTLGGVDAIIFTAGVGENAARVREMIMAQLAFLGRVPSYVIAADEEGCIARHVRDLI